MEKTYEAVPRWAHESDMARMERSNNRLWIVVILLVVALVGSNAGWIWYESQFEDVVTTTYEADASDGGNAIANGSGSVEVNGEG